MVVAAAAATLLEPYNIDFIFLPLASAIVSIQRLASENW